MGNVDGDSIGMLLDLVLTCHWRNGREDREKMQVAWNCALSTEPRKTRLLRGSAQCCVTGQVRSALWAPFLLLQDEVIRSLRLLLCSLQYTLSSRVHSCEVWKSARHSDIQDSSPKAGSGVGQRACLGLELGALGSILLGRISVPGLEKHTHVFEPQSPECR